MVVVVVVPCCCSEFVASHTFNSTGDNLVISPCNRLISPICCAVKIFWRKRRDFIILALCFFGSVDAEIRYSFDISFGSADWRNLAHSPIYWMAKETGVFRFGNGGISINNRKSGRFNLTVLFPRHFIGPQDTLRTSWWTRTTFSSSLYLPVFVLVLLSFLTNGITPVWTKECVWSQVFFFPFSLFFYSHQATSGWGWLERNSGEQPTERIAVLC